MDAEWLAGASDADVAPTAVSREEFDAFLQVLLRFHPRPPPAPKKKAGRPITKPRVWDRSGGRATG